MVRVYERPAHVLILEFLRSVSRPASALEIAEGTGINYNTVRGRLQDLKREGLVVNVGRKWVLKRKCRYGSERKK